MSLFEAPVATSAMTSSSRGVNPNSRWDSAGGACSLASASTNEPTVSRPIQVLARHHRPQALEEQFRRRRLEQHTGRPQPQRQQCVRRIDPGGEQDCPQAPGLGAELPQHVEAAHAWHRHVQQQHVGMKRSYERDGLSTVSCLADHREVRLCFEQIVKPSPKDGMIVGDQHAYGRVARHAHLSAIPRRCAHPRRDAIRL